MVKGQERMECLCALEGFVWTAQPSQKLNQASKL